MLQSDPPQYLIRRLERFAKLSGGDRQILEEATRNVRRIGARETVIREGERPSQINFILDGWAHRYKTLEDGRRQIVSFLLPGDLCDLNVFVLRQMDHSVGTITPVRVVDLARETFEAITERHTRIAQALWWAALVNEATHREWVLNVGQRTAIERLAHLLCELFVRLEAVGLTDGASCEMPVTQAELADATGLSTVHVNRTLQELRGLGLIELRGRQLTIPDLAALQRVGLFNDNYLHLNREGSHLDANER
jgi:CRP-like cAMP-binding protein